MKLRNVFIFLALCCRLSIFAMSSEKKAEFKRQIKAASSSREMCKLVGDELSCDRNKMEIRLKLDTPIHINWDHEPMTPSFVIEADADVAITDKDRAVKNAVEEAFFEEMHQFVYQGGNIDQELGKFEKYWWANNQVLANLRGIFGMRNMVSTVPQDNQLYQLVKNRVAELSNENNIWDGKNDFSQRVLWTMHKHRGLVMVAVLCGIYYYWASKKAEEQGDEETEADQETIKNDDTRGASVSTI